MILQGNGAAFMPGNMPGQSRPPDMNPAEPLSPVDAPEPFKAHEQMSLDYHDFSNLEIAEAILEKGGPSLNEQQGLIKEVRGMLQEQGYLDRQDFPDLSLRRRDPNGNLETIRFGDMNPPALREAQEPSISERENIYPRDFDALEITEATDQVSGKGLSPRQEIIRDVRDELVARGYFESEGKPEVYFSKRRDDGSTESLRVCAEDPRQWERLETLQMPEEEASKYSYQERINLKRDEIIGNDLVGSTPERIELVEEVRELLEERGFFDSELNPGAILNERDVSTGKTSRSIVVPPLFDEQEMEFDMEKDTNGKWLKH